MGLLPDVLPGYRPVGDAAGRAALARAWNADLPAEPGIGYDEMLSAGVKALYVIGANPVRHMTSEQIVHLGAIDFLVVQDMFLTETAQRADGVLPAAAYTGKDSTFPSTERCVQA